MASVIPIEPIEPVIKKKKTQPSRKGKKAWRKNVDITEIEKTLEGIRDEERITGGRIRDLPDEKIFTIDTLGDVEENNSKIPAIFSKPKKQNDHKKHYVSKYNKFKSEESEEEESKESKESKELVKKKKSDHVKLTTENSVPTKVLLKTGEYDVWNEEESDELLRDDDNDFLPPMKKRKIKPPPTMNVKPFDTIPAVHFPHPGTSYNPKFEDHQSLLKIAHEEEVVKLQKKEKLQSQLPVLSEMPTSVMNPEDMVVKDIDEEKSSEDEVEENERNEVIEKQKNKEEKLKKNLGENWKKIIQSFNQEFTEREKQQAEKAKAAEEKANLPLKKIGKYSVKKLPIDVQLQEELSESLRTLKPEGNLFRDRMVSLEERNIIEPRVKVKKRKRKFKLREFEKSSYKNFNK
ncbi:16334_t:CDS:10 [Rhizophagus irregularis]|nr:16334_t:CDS:10 [Rhizophagus irregularis]